MLMGMIFDGAQRVGILFGVLGLCRAQEAIRPYDSDWVSKPEAPCIRLFIEEERTCSFRALPTGFIGGSACWIESCCSRLVGVMVTCWPGLYIVVV